MSNVTEYSSKATALRGIERAGIADKAVAATMVTKQESGKWGFDLDAVNAKLGLAADISEADENLILGCGHSHCPECGIHLENGLLDFDSLEDQHGAKRAYELQKHEWSCMGCNAEWGKVIEAPKGAKAAKVRTTEKRTYENKSTVEGAVAVCHRIFTANPDLRRKDAIKLAEDAGVAFYTARTQYQKWFKAK